jgi:hypothetical protein
MGYFGNKYKSNQRRLSVDAKMNNRLITIALIVCLASLVVFGTAKAQTVTPGLTPGQVYTYRVTSHWSSSDSYASIPQDLIDFNNTDSIEVRISDVNATSVNTFTAIYYNNGTSPMATRGTVNVQTGEGTGGFVALIGGNLAAGQRIHPAGADTITINYTQARTYESGNRQTNEIQISARNDTASATSTVDRFFDQITGMLVESTESYTVDSPASSNSVTWRLVSTQNAWAIPEFPVLALLPIAMIATSLALIAYKKKHTMFKL